MENAVKALLITAGVLVGLMILSLAISLYASLSKYVETAQSERTSREIQEFNEQFLRFINCSDSSSSDIEFTLTIQDIVTAANIAYENNNADGYYVAVKLGTDSLERKINTEATKILEEGLENTYRCPSETVKISPETGRVSEIIFYLISE